MKIVGLTFVGTRTAARSEMVAFARDVLGLRPAQVEGADADFFELPDGSTFAVTVPDPDEPAGRTVGFLVEDVDQAVAELRAAGIEADDVEATDRHRYAHFRAPDGRLYELVQEQSPAGSG